jgi:hypothetical protein
VEEVFKRKTPVSDWADPKTVFNLVSLEAERKPLEEIRAAALAKHRELAPMVPSN